MVAATPKTFSEWSYPGHSQVKGMADSFCATPGPTCIAQVTNRRTEQGETGGEHLQASLTRDQ